MQAGPKIELKTFEYFFHPAFLPELRYMVVEEYLLDYLNARPAALAKVNRAFRELLNHPGFIKHLILKYRPFLQNHSNYLSSPGLALTSIDTLLLDVKNATLECSLIGLTQHLFVSFAFFKPQSLEEAVTLYLKRAIHLIRLRREDVEHGIKRILAHFQQLHFNEEKLIAQLKQELPDVLQKKDLASPEEKKIHDRQSKSAVIVHVLTEIKKQASQFMSSTSEVKLNNHLAVCQHPDMSQLEKIPNWNFRTALEGAMAAGNISLIFALMDVSGITDPMNISHFNWARGLHREDIIDKLLKQRALAHGQHKDEQLKRILNKLSGSYISPMFVLKTDGYFNKYHPMEEGYYDKWDLKRQFSNYSVEHFENILKYSLSLLRLKSLDFIVRHAMRANRIDLLLTAIPKVSLSTTLLLELLTYASSKNELQLMKALIPFRDRAPKQFLIQILNMQNTDLIGLALDGISYDESLLFYLAKVFYWATKNSAVAIQTKTLAIFPQSMKSQVIINRSYMSYFKKDDNENLHPLPSKIFPIWLRKEVKKAFTLSAISEILLATLESKEWEFAQLLLSTNIIASSTEYVEFMELIISTHPGSATAVLFCESGKLCNALKYVHLTSALPLACSNYPRVAKILLEHCAPDLFEDMDKMQCLNVAYQKNYLMLVAQLVKNFPEDLTYKKLGHCFGYEHALVHHIFPHLVPPGMFETIQDAIVGSVKSFLPQYFSQGAPSKRTSPNELEPQGAIKRPKREG